MVDYLELHFYDPKDFGKLPYPLKLFWIYFTLGIFVKTYCYIRYLLANRNLYIALIWSPLYRDIEPPFKGIFTGEYEIKKLPKKRSLLLLFGYLFVLTLMGMIVVTPGLTSPTPPSDYRQALSYISIDTWLSVDLWGRTVNSNTVYAIFGRLMGLSVYSFSGLKIEPGITNEDRLVPSDLIDKYRQNLINAGIDIANKKVIDLSQKEYSDSFWENLANDKEGTEAGCGAGCQCGCQMMGPSPWWDKKLDINDPWDNAKRTSSPLVLDLNGNGISTTSLDNGVYFDHDGNGFAGKSGWLSKGEGILALDRNDNGVIDDGGELFGNNTLLANGKYAINGFEALKAFDINRDGVIDEKDAIYKDLKVWVDNNGDAFSDKDELLTLEEAGVKSINLGYINSNYVDEHGNAHKQQGSFTKSDGTTAVINDVWFSVDYTGTINIDISQIATR